jgi:orotate phosphoribosyltransferase
MTADFDDARRGIHGLPTLYDAIYGLQLQVANLYADARMMRSDFPEAANCYAQRAAALSLAARVLAGVETAGDISAAAASATSANDSAQHRELSEARKTIRIMSTQHGQLQLRIAQLETELWKHKQHHRRD